MAERASVFNQSRLGVESLGAQGTLVIPTKRLLATAFDPEPNVPTIPFRALGSLTPTTALQQKEWTQGNISGDLSFNDLSYLYASILTSVSPSTPTGAVNTRRWSFKPNQFTPDTYQTFTVDRGSAAGAERWQFCLIDSLTHRWTRTEAVLSGTFMGQQLQEATTLSGSPVDIAPLPIDPKSMTLYVGSSFSTNNVQIVTIGGAPTGGTFTLSLDNQTTAPIAFNAVGATVQAALILLPNINTNNVTVTGAAGGPYTITFLDRLAGTNQSLITGNITLLTGGAPTFANVNSVPGSMTKLVRASSFEMAIPARFGFGFTLNQGDPSYSYFVNKGIEPTSQLVLEHDSASVTFMSTLRARTTNFLTAIAWGLPTEAGFANCLRITFPFKFIQSVRSDVDDVYASTYSLALMYDSGFSGYLQCDVDNLILAL
jgi:hypothetical protein